MHDPDAVKAARENLEAAGLLTGHGYRKGSLLGFSRPGEPTQLLSSSGVPASMFERKRRRLHETRYFFFR